MKKQFIKPTICKINMLAETIIAASGSTPSTGADPGTARAREQNTGLSGTGDLSTSSLDF